MLVLAHTWRIADGTGMFFMGLVFVMFLFKQEPYVARAISKRGNNVFRIHWKLEAGSLDQYAHMCDSTRAIDIDIDQHELLFSHGVSEYLTKWVQDGTSNKYCHVLKVLEGLPGPFFVPSPTRRPPNKAPDRNPKNSRDRPRGEKLSSVCEAMSLLGQCLEGDGTNGRVN